MRRISILISAFCTCFVLASWPQAFEDRQPKFIMFDAPDGGAGNGQGTIAIDINSDWAITGFYTDANYVAHGFVRDPWGKITEFDAAGRWQERQLLPGYCRHKHQRLGSDYGTVRGLK
jgi:hypothetical protein